MTETKNPKPDALFGILNFDIACPVALLKADGIGVSDLGFRASNFEYISINRLLLMGFIPHIVSIPSTRN